MGMRWIAGFAAVALTVWLGAGCGEDQPPAGPAAEPAGTIAPVETVRPPSTTALQEVGGAEVRTGAEPVVSPGLGELEEVAAQAPPGEGEESEVEDSVGRFRIRAPAPEPELDPVLDRGPAESVLEGPLSAFEGIRYDGEVAICCPPDAIGDIGAEHYVEWVNSGLQVYDRQGEALLGSPLPGNALFSQLGAQHPCARYNRGDPVVVYDQFAGRWVLTQFAFPLDATSEPTGPSYSCIAVSRSSDPLADWCVSFVKYDDAEFYDYPKLGVWGNAYVVSANTFRNKRAISQLLVLERDRLLACDRAPRVARLLEESGHIWLPADADGTQLPGTDEPAVFVSFDDDGWYEEEMVEDALLVLELRANFERRTAVASLSRVPVAAFDSNLCDYVSACAAVPEGGEPLDIISDRPMNRAAFRRADGYDVVVLTHTVDVDGADRAGVRWYELRRDAAGWQVAQQGTFAPDDGSARWLGSAAMDAAGNLAVAYVVAGPDTNPSIRYAARRPDDPPGTLALGEGTLIEGGGVQTGGGNRWGDYGALTLDPLDDCTFWYTGQYYPETSEGSWATRIVSFRLPGCLPG